MFPDCFWMRSCGPPEDSDDEEASSGSIGSCHERLIGLGHLGRRNGQMV